MSKCEKHCNTCLYSYWQEDHSGVNPKMRLAQHCRNPVYNSPAYTEKMMLADSARDYCRLWTPRPGKGN